MITYKKIRWRNFLSTGNVWTEVDLNSHKKLLIIGSNGNGKSTIIDAICFALFGKPYRDINKPQLVNNINSKDCLVEIEFETMGREFLVRRGIKPDVFEVYSDGKLVNQDPTVMDYQKYLEKAVLKCNLKSFTQIDILGSARYTPFMQLKPAIRREVIEDLLDIQVFSSMNTIAKKRLSDNKAAGNENAIKVRALTEKVEYLEDVLEKLRKNASVEIQSLVQKNVDTKDERSKLIDENTFLKGKRLEKSKKAKKLETSFHRMNAIQGLALKLESKIQKTKEDLDFFTHQLKCPLCSQEIDQQHQQKMCTELQTVYDGQERNLDLMRAEITKLDIDTQKMHELEVECKALEQQEYKNQVKIEGLQREYEKVERTIQQVAQKGTIESETLVAIDKAKDDLLKASKERKALATERERLELVVQFLKDSGIKSTIIKKYIPELNKQINRFLSDMGFWIDFELDENFEETIKMPHMEKFTYGSFSEGQKLRIDLAILWAFREIARQRNSVNSNLLIMDEIFDSSLDKEGVEEFLDIIYKFIDTQNTIIISHKYELLDKFDKTIEFVRPKNFSKIKE